MPLSCMRRFVNAPLVIVVWMLWGSDIAASAERPMGDARIAVAANFRDTAEAIHCISRRALTIVTTSLLAQRVSWPAKSSTVRHLMC